MPLRVGASIPLHTGNFGGDLDRLKLAPSADQRKTAKPLESGGIRAVIPLADANLRYGRVVVTTLSVVPSGFFVRSSTVVPPFDPVRTVSTAPVVSFERCTVATP